MFVVVRRGIVTAGQHGGASESLKLNFTPHRPLRSRLASVAPEEPPLTSQPGGRRTGSAAETPDAERVGARSAGRRGDDTDVSISSGTSVGHLSAVTR